MFTNEHAEALRLIQHQLDMNHVKGNSLLIAAEMIRSGQAKVVWRACEGGFECFVQADNGVIIYVGRA